MIPDLTTAQLQALKAAIQAEPNVAAALAAGNMVAIADYYNGASASNAWRAAPRDDMYGAMQISSFDNLTAGKRDAWRMVLDYAPTDFRKAKFRKAVTDIWGATEAASVLTGCAVRAATRAELLFGGTDRTESTVTAKVLNVEGLLTYSDVVQALGS